jgi:hypothetical protein
MDAVLGIISSGVWMSDASGNPKPSSEQPPLKSGRAVWERPVLRRLEAREAQHGNKSGNDTRGNNTGS